MGHLKPDTAHPCRIRARAAVINLRQREKPATLSRNRRNLPIVGIVVVFAGSNLQVHLEALGLTATGNLGLRLASPP